MVQNKDLDAASETLLYNRGKITSATQAKLKKMAEIVTNFASVDNILPDLHNSPRSYFALSNNANRPLALRGHVANASVKKMSRNLGDAKN